MRWLRCRDRGSDTWAIHEGDAVEIVDGTPYGTHARTGRRLPLEGLQWLPPVQPGKILGLWNNFGAAAAKNGWSRPAEPLWFLKAAGSLTAHDAPIPAPPEGTGRIAYEGELAIVIGRRARRIDAAQAQAHVLGYACANDVTAIELLNRDPSFAQWARAKGFDGFCPIGPCRPNSIRRRPACAPASTVASARTIRWPTCSSRRTNWSRGCRTMSPSSPAT